MNGDVGGFAAIVVALITAVVSGYTQRGSKRAARQTAQLAERGTALQEFEAIRKSLREEIAELRADVAQLRAEVDRQRQHSREQDALLKAAVAHIKSLRLLLSMSRTVPPAIPSELTILVNGP